MPTPEVRLGDGRYTSGQLLFQAPVAGSLWNGFPIEFVAEPLSSFDPSATFSSDILSDITIPFPGGEHVTSDAEWAPIVVADGNSGLIRGWLPQIRFVDMNCIQGSLNVKLEASDNNAGLTTFHNVDLNMDFFYVIVAADVGNSPVTSSWFTAFASPGTCGAAPDPFTLLHLTIESTSGISDVQLASGSVEMRWIFAGDFVPYDVGDPAQTPLSIDYTGPGPGEGLTIHATTNQCGQVDSDCTWNDIKAIVEGGTPIAVTASHGTERSRALWAGEMSGGSGNSATISYHGGVAQ